MSTTWTGVISFGLVTIPVGLHKATGDNSIQLRGVHKLDSCLTHQLIECTGCGNMLTRDEVGKGYKTVDGTYLQITEEDLATLPKTPKKTLAVQKFIPDSSINPLALDGSYFVQPREGGIPAFALLRDAMASEGKAAICEMTMSTRHRLAALQVNGDGMMLTTLLWPDEVRSPDFKVPDSVVRPQELRMAISLINGMSGAWDDAEFADPYRTGLQQLVAAKLAGEDLPSAPAEPAPATSSLADTLRASLDLARQAKGAAKTTAAKSAPARRRTTRKAG